MGERQGTVRDHLPADGWVQHVVCQVPVLGWIRSVDRLPKRKGRSDLPKGTFVFCLYFVVMVLFFFGGMTVLNLLADPLSVQALCNSAEKACQTTPAGNCNQYPDDQQPCFSGFVEAANTAMQVGIALSTTLAAVALAL
jgi:hypothetical protein